MLETFAKTFISILLHIVLDNERAKANEAFGQQTTKKTLVAPLGVVGPIPERKLSNTYLVAVFLAKIFFPTTNIILIFTFLCMGLNTFMEPFDLEENDVC